MFVFGMSGKLGRELAVELEKLQQFAQLEQSFDEVIRAWAHTIEIRERSSHLHHYDLAANWTAEIAREVGISENKLVHLRRGAILHDIGKMAIPERILCKPGFLSPDEWDIMRRHPILGYDIISHINLLSPSRDVVLVSPRALGRNRIPQRPFRQRDPPIRAHLYRGECLGCPDLRPAVSPRLA